MNNFLVHDDKTKREMLDIIGINSVEDLFTQIPEQARMRSLSLDDALSELETQRKVKSLAKKNNTE